MTENIAQDLTSPGGEFPNEKLMTLLEHLNELKDRVIRMPSPLQSGAQRALC